MNSTIVLISQAIPQLGGSNNGEMAKTSLHIQLSHAYVVLARLSCSYLWGRHLWANSHKIWHACVISQHNQNFQFCNKIFRGFSSCFPIDFAYHRYDRSACDSVPDLLKWCSSVNFGDKRMPQLSIWCSDSSFAFGL